MDSALGNTSSMYSILYVEIVHVHLFSMYPIKGSFNQQNPIFHTATKFFPCANLTPSAYLGRVPIFA